MALIDHWKALFSSSVLESSSSVQSDSIRVATANEFVRLHTAYEVSKERVKLIAMRALAEQNIDGSSFIKVAVNPSDPKNKMLIVINTTGVDDPVTNVCVAIYVCDEIGQEQLEMYKVYTALFNRLYG